MYIAMNRFKIVRGKEKEFEDVWKNRDTHLEGVQGCKNFNLSNSLLLLEMFLS